MAVLLDAEGLNQIARRTPRSLAFVEDIESSFAVVFYVPMTVVTEVTTGWPSDAPLHRFISVLDDPKKPGFLWLPLTVPIASLAGTLRTDAHAARQGMRISAVDAQVVAHAVQLSTRETVTILTSDPNDLNALLDAMSQRPINISVEAI